jgi:ubiquitin-like 1-activating enzyme E1 B
VPVVPQSAHKKTGIKDGSFLTVIDDEDDEPFVNVVINVEEGSLEEQEAPYKSSIEGEPSIPKRPKTAAADANGSTEQNGSQKDGVEVLSESKGVKRPHPDDEEPPAKKAKLASSGDDGAVVIEEGGSGAIVIGDD